jgi:hypothetical protein
MQERGEQRDRCRVLDALRETMLGPGTPRIIRAGLPDRGALVVVEGLRLAAIFGLSPSQLTTLCVNCGGHPPAGFACLACGTRPQMIR